MEITYANGKVEKYFKDYKKMQKKLPFEWVKTIKKHMDRLKAAECFGDFLKLRLGKPEQLEGCESIRYSLHVAANVRLIIEPNAEQDTVMICTEIEVEGVSDYHGSKFTREKRLQTSWKNVESHRVNWRRVQAFLRLT